MVAESSSGTSGDSASVTIETGSTAPQPPTGLAAASGGATSVDLTWTAPTDQGGSAVTGYQVLAGASAASEAAVPAQYVTVSGTSAVVTGLSTGDTDYFEVQATNSSSPDTSGGSNQVTGVAAAAPAAPGDVVATGDYQSVALTWSPPSTDNGAAVTGYDAYQGASAADAEDSTTPVNPSLITATSFTVTGLSDGTEEYFSVRAVNAAGTSAATTAVHATPDPGAPSAPTAVTATPDGTLMGLIWKAPSDLNGSVVEGYDIYDGTSATAAPSTGPLNDATLVAGTAVILDGLTVGDVYYFAVEAVTADGDSALSATSAGTTQTAAESVPSAPGTPVAKAGASPGAITVTWTAPASDGGTPVTDYLLTPYRSGTAEASIDTDSTATTYTATGLSDGGSYAFTVTAVNSVGDGAASALSAGVVAPSVAPASIAVTNRAGRGDVIVAGVAADSSTVELYDEAYGSTTFVRAQTKTAGPTGDYAFTPSIRRSTYFYVETDGVRSATKRSEVTDDVTLSLVGGTRALTATVSTDPTVSGVDVTFDRVGAGGSLTRLKTVRITSSSGTLRETLASTRTGALKVKAVVAGGDGGYGGTSATKTVTVKR